MHRARSACPERLLEPRGEGVGSSGSVRRDETAPEAAGEGGAHRAPGLTRGVRSRRRIVVGAVVLLTVQLGPLLGLEAVLLAKVLVSPPQAGVTSPPPTSPPWRGPIRVTEGPFSATSGPVTLTVHRIEASVLRVRVHLTVANGTATTLSMPEGTFVGVDDTRHAYDVFLHSPGWPSDEVPAGGARTGFIELEEPLFPGARSLTVGWGHIFEAPEVGSLYVGGIDLA
jgi:hypothetical protein